MHNLKFETIDIEVGGVFCYIFAYIFRLLLSIYRTTDYHVTYITSRRSLNITK